HQGIYGWQVTDCTVTMTHSGYSSVSSTAGDFRNLTPLVLMSALKQASTSVYEPLHRFHLEIPAGTFGSILAALARLRAVPQTPPEKEDRGAASPPQTPGCDLFDTHTTRSLLYFDNGERTLCHSAARSDRSV